MKRNPARPSPPAQAKTGGKGLSGPTSAEQSADGLHLPHERDQDHGQVARAPDPVIEQARRDLAAGQVDTDMRATPGLDAARRGRMVSTPPAQAATQPGAETDKALSGARKGPGGKT
jgi:hypothetical protein